MNGLYLGVLAITRVALPVLAVLLAVGWFFRFRALGRPAAPTVAKFVTVDGVELPITVGEGYIGRKANCDVTIPVATISKRHAMLYQQGGDWWIAPIGGEVSVNGTPVEDCALLMEGDQVGFGEEQLTFISHVYPTEDISSSSSRLGDGWLLVILTLFQLLMGAQLCLRYASDLPAQLPLCFGGLMGAQWVYYLFNRFVGKTPLLCEIPVLFLTTLGLAVCAASAPEELDKQLLCLAIGGVAAGLLTFLVRHENWCFALRLPIAALTLGVMWFTALFGTATFGSRNWLFLGPFSVQPSEFAKIALLLVGGCALYVAAQYPKNRWFFLLFAALTMGALVVMVDFGAVLIFFVTMLVILSMRFTSPLLIGGMAGGAVVAGSVLLLVYPHIANRFGAWMHVWEYADTSGYQQTRTLLYAASGGLFGVGGGNGHLLEVAASDTDLVFGVLCEEWGSIIALCAALCFVALGVYARYLAGRTKSAFQAIGVCGAAAMMLVQTALNLFGSTDILPLTGVTMMFVSRGGSSLIAAFMLIAFFKGAEATPSPLFAERREEE